MKVVVVGKKLSVSAIGVDTEVANDPSGGTTYFVRRRSGIAIAQRAS